MPFIQAVCVCKPCLILSRINGPVVCVPMKYSLEGKGECWCATNDMNLSVSTTCSYLAGYALISRFIN